MSVCASPGVDQTNLPDKPTERFDGRGIEYEEDMTRTDETWFRLRQWTQGQAPSERLAAQVLAYSGFDNIDPSHPLGGKDGGRDAVCSKDGRRWIMAVNFPRDEQTFGDIKRKFVSDLESATKHQPYGLAFVTNQEIRLSERAELRELGADKGVTVELFHLERVAHILDEPSMSPIRKQYLDIDPGPLPIAIELEIIGTARHLVGGEDVRDWWLEHAAEKERARHTRNRQQTALNPAITRMQWMQSALPPLTEADLEERIERWEREVRRRWAESEDHLASTTWPGLRFRLKNTGEVFLNDVQVIITISGVRGLQCLHLDRFDQAKLLSPVIPAPKDPYAGIDPSFYDDLRIADYPVTWKSLDDSVEITLDLKHLRPHPAWVSEADDIILVANLAASSEVTAEWTVTAQGYGKVYEGQAITIPVEQASIQESLSLVSSADKRSSK
ncbi:hypothetical protein N601_30105 [Rhodococcus erythropolis DN1]|nr:hypothetical protein N601_30105 [Rhodococcus erythropolis DN1]